MISIGQSYGFTIITKMNHYRQILLVNPLVNCRRSYYVRRCALYSMKKEWSIFHDKRNVHLWNNDPVGMKEMNGPTKRTTLFRIQSRPFLVSSLHLKNRNDEVDHDDCLLDKLHVPITMKKTLWDHVIQPLHLEHNHNMVILVSVSGGCDSIALFYSLLELMEQNIDGSFYIPFFKNHRICCKVHVVHFDHEQRGENSQGDRLYVEQICKQYDIPFHVYFWNDENHGGALYNSTHFSQERARNWRRHETQRLMENIKSQNETGIIVTAHHRDDVEETVLMKMLRGVHITNISGIDVLQQIKDRIYFVKPLLHVRKKNLEGFLLQNGVSWREDESNASDKYLRNRVRNELMPLLHDIVGGQDILSSRLDNMQKQSKKVKKDLTLRATQLLKDMHNANDVEFFVLPNKCNDLDVVQEEALFQWVNTRTNGGLHLSYDKILAIGEQLSNFPERLQWKLSVGEGWKMERNGYVLILHNEKDTKYASSEVGQWTIVEKETPRQMTDDHVRVRLRFKLDVSTKIHVKRAGDVKAVKFHPIWRSNSMKLKDFLRGQKIPLHKRDSTPILSMDIDGESTVLAVYIETKKVESETLNEKWCIHKDYNVEEKGGECRELELHLSFG